MSTEIRLEWIGYKLFVGKVYVGYVSFSGAVPKGSKNNYAVVPLLLTKGKFVNLGMHPDLESGKEALEKYTRDWFNHALST